MGAVLHFVVVDDSKVSESAGGAGVGVVVIVLVNKAIFHRLRQVQGRDGIREFGVDVQVGRNSLSRVDVFGRGDQVVSRI